MQNHFPDIKDLFICFSHENYEMEQTFKKRDLNISHSQARSPEELSAMIAKANILVISGMWNYELLDIAPKLKFIQSISAGSQAFRPSLVHTSGCSSAHLQAASGSLPAWLSKRVLMGASFDS